MMKSLLLVLLLSPLAGCATSDWQTIRSKPPTPEQQTEAAFWLAVAHIDAANLLINHGYSALEADLVLYDTREIIGTLARDINIVNDADRWSERRQVLIDRIVIVVERTKRADGSPVVSPQIAELYAAYLVDEVANQVRHLLRIA